VIHPSKNIIGTKGNELEDKKIIMCITGSVAAVKSPEICRELMRHGDENDSKIERLEDYKIEISEIEWATGNPVVTELTGKIEQITTNSTNFSNDTNKRILYFNKMFV
jgi:phosphopantothenoylcysteine decarboxylase/phosphopantothenate--cysteine ligase